jgi:alpha-1,2-mannosyltransferase
VPAFCVFALANLVAAAFSPIQDCDEVFNYWEPTHYLNHGYGLQTWEYSPEYAIRSWTYTGLHALLLWAGMLPIRLLGYMPTKVVEFYFLRAVLAVTCAACSTRFYSVIRRTVNARIATFFMMILVISPGMYHAAPAYLPSTFAMYCTMLGLAAFMDRSGNTLRTSQGITWMAVGSVLGWPFAGALVLPFVAEDIFAGWLSGRLDLTFWRLFRGASRGLAVLFIQTVIDSFFYRELVCVPLNIVLYNVFSGGSRGPDIYGVEPWHFYIRNLALNFNIWFFLALAAPLIVMAQYYFARTPISWHTLLRSLFNVSPFYLWLAVFTIQPHKEERFMYPAYPALAWNAAFALHLLLANFGMVKKIRVDVKLVIVAIPMLLAFNVGMLRIVGTFQTFRLPLSEFIAKCIRVFDYVADSSS